MEEKMQTEDGLNLLDLLKVLLRKIKILVLVVLIGAVAGAAFAVWRTVDVDYYGTTVEFYVNPETPESDDGSENNSQYGVYGAYGRHVMDNMVKLLNSESFTEQMILNGNPLPEKGKWVNPNNPKETALNLDSLIDEAQAALDLAEQTGTKEDAKTAETAVEKALDAWGKTEKYNDAISKYASAVSFSYLKEDEDADDANNLARSFIYVEISVLNDREFAEELLEVVKTVVPDYVEAKMIVPTGYVGTNCKRITRSDDIKLTNPGYTTKQALLYGAIAGVIAGLVACVVVIVIDRSDKRLRDYEIITKKFNVPILGVVPTIDEFSSLNETKINTEAKK